MNDDVVESIFLSKQILRKKLLKLKCKRRALTNTRCVVLDEAYNNLCATSSNVMDKLIAKDLKLSNVHRHKCEELQELNTDANKYNKLNESDIDTNKHDDRNEYDDPNELNIEGYEHSDISVIDTDEYTYENSMDYLNSCFTGYDKNLHNLTNISAHEFCTRSLLLLRDAKMCKSQSDKLTHLIHSSLPTPNNMPKSMKQILTEMQGKSQIKHDYLHTIKLGAFYERQVVID